MSTASVALTDTTRGLDHRTVWRWHFYAGLFCIPFVLWLATTGTIFLFKPQIERFLDRPYDHLSIVQRARVNAQVQAAIAAVPGSTLDSYELPRNPTSAAEILVDKGTQQFRVYIHPQTLQVLKLDNEDHRLENVVFKLHGELMMGDVGSWIVELAASWAVIMIVTGLFLWWPSNASGLAGVLYPRLRASGRTFWKDIHSVAGVYVSFFALFLLFTGLPWAKGWGGYLKAIRHLSAGRVVGQDWTTSSSEIIAARAARTGAGNNIIGIDDMNGTHDMSGMSNMHDMPGMTGMHHMEGMEGMSSSEHAQHDGMHGAHHGSGLTGPNAFVAIDRMVATVVPLDLAYPVLISPPSGAGGNWTAKSDTRDRPLRVDLVLDAKTGAVLKRTDFQSKPWLDRVIGTGIAAHEGALFGFANQMVSLFTAVSLVTLSLSGLVMWWKRRPSDVLGAPAPIRRVRFSAGLLTLLVAFGLYFPFLGGSIILVGLTERFILRRIPAAQRWLGLSMAAAG
jgi:uncharacterized iron-regulated membrane protein